MITIGLVGNPNSGKTTLFNALTGARQKVGNWPGVTVSRKCGQCKVGKKEIRVIDLPGTYSLNMHSSTSMDVEIANDFILSKEADLIVNIVDASNLERNLFLTMQLLEMGVPMLVGLNMIDVIKQRKHTIDIKALSKKLGCPVVPISASKKEGIDVLKTSIYKAIKHGKCISESTTFPIEITQAIEKLSTVIHQHAPAYKDNTHCLAIRLLEEDRYALGKLSTKLSRQNWKIS